MIYGNSIGYIKSIYCIHEYAKNIHFTTYQKEISSARVLSNVDVCCFQSITSLWCSFLWGYCSKKYINTTSKILAGTYAKLFFEMDAVTRADPEFFL